MESLYIIEPGSYMKVSGKSIKIEKKGQVIEEIPASDLKRLTLAGRCSMTGAVLDFLIENGIETVFMTLTGRFRARLLLDAPGHVELRQLQYERLGKKDFCLQTARFMVLSKIENQLRLLRKRRPSAKDPNFKKLHLQLLSLKRRAKISKNLDELRGIEGSASRIFYQGFGLLIKNQDFSFTGRNRRPPKDEINALLSFVYTLFTNEVLNAIKSNGLDPYLGALHEPLSGRPSLACDLVEEWRALAEGFVLTLVNKKMVTKQDFIATGKKKRPIEMAPPFLRALIRTYEKVMSKQISWNNQQMKIRWAIHQRIRDFISYLKTPERGIPKRAIPI